MNKKINKGYKYWNKQYRSVLKGDKFSDTLSRCYREYEYIEISEKMKNHSRPEHRIMLNKTTGIYHITIPMNIIRDLELNKGDTMIFSVSDKIIQIKKVERIK